MAIWPWVVLLTALAASFGLWEWQRHDAAMEAALRARTQARRAIDAFEADLAELAKLELTARAIAATVGTNVRFDEEGWRRYVDALDLPGVHGSAILAVAFAERVPHAGLGAHVERQRRIHPASGVQQADVRGIYHPIVLLRRITEPGIPAPIGFAPFTMPERRTAMMEALAKRGIAYSGAMVHARATLPRDRNLPDSSPGVVMLVPVFPAVAAGPEAGFVGIALRPEKLLTRSLGAEPGIGATLTPKHGEKGPVQLRVGNTEATGDMTAHETAPSARGGVSWQLDVLVTDTLPTQSALFDALIAGACALFAICVGIDRSRRPARAALVHARADGDARFRDLANDAPFMLWVSDAKMHPTYVNDAWSSTTRQPSQIARGHGWHDFVHPDDLPAITQTFRAMAGAPIPCTVRGRMLMHDGTYRWHLANVRPRRDADGNQIGFIGISFDVHELQSAEIALERERGLLRGVLDGSPACIFVKDDAHRYILQNPAVETLRGIGAEQLLGRTDSEFFPPETAARYLAQDEAVMRSGVLLRTQEMFDDADGRQRWMLKTKNLVTLSSGERLLVGWALENTDMKRLEAETATARRRIEAQHQLATWTLAGDAPPALGDLAVGAIASLIPGTAVRLLPMTDAGAEATVAQVFAGAPMALARLQAGHAVVLPGGPSEASAEESEGLLPADVRARIAVPLGHGDHLQGALSVEARTDRTWGADDVQVAMEIAEAPCSRPWSSAASGRSAHSTNRACCSTASSRRCL